MHKNRLLKLADHLESDNRGHKKFDFSLLTNAMGNSCGTAGCAMGELPIAFPRAWKFRSGTIGLRKGSAFYYSNDVQTFFGLDSSEENHLFYPGLQNVKAYGGKALKGSARPNTVAKGIRDFVAKKELDKSNKEFTSGLEFLL